ncbi:MAG: adenosine-specific kinase [Spirochaetota bacterium]
MELKTVPVQVPEGLNVIIGQSHFIKTVEDLYEAVVNTSAAIKFGLAFNEASGPCLVRKDGNDQQLISLAVETARSVGAGHLFVLYLKDAFPIQVLPAVREVREVLRIFCATANPLQVVVCETEQGRGVLGVVDGASPRGVEGTEETEARIELLKKFGYKR